MRPHRKKGRILAVLALALLCIGSVELIACRYFDPTLYHTIVDPVQAAAQRTIDGVNHAASAAVSYTRMLSDQLRDAIDDAMDAARAARAQRAASREQAKADALAKNEAEENAPPAQEEPDDQAVTAPLLNIPPSVCDPSVTELKAVGQQNILTGGPIKIVYYQQGDERWSDLKYGSDRIGSHGCGPTAMAMVVSSMTNTVILPQEMAQWAVDHGHWARRSGSYHSIVLGAAAAFGLQAESFPARTADALRAQLMSGKLLVALMGPGHFTQSGHFIILRGVTLSGDILVADPGSAERSLTAWDAQLILDELSKSTASGSPLWLVSSGETIP